MPLTVGQFLQSLNDGGILAKEDVARVEQSWPAERRGEDAKPMAIELVRQKLLTQFQALNLYHGKAQFLVLGNYILLDILGEGGMGKVYKAVHRRMQRTVALKLLPAALTKETEILRRFQREVQAAAQLVHPNIVTAYDADEAQGVYFLVMEYVDGQDLGSYLKEHGVLPVALAVDCVMQAARGLEYAHAKGVVHRDIKPSNLLLSRDGVVKVMDLGLARFDQSLAEPGEMGGERPIGASDPRRERTELTRQGQIIGTVSYMAPEQSIEMGLADARSDIYALGCTLYRLLTGDVPYSRDTAEATMAAHREAPIPSLRKFRRDVTPQLDAVMRKMLAKQPTERYQSMAEVITALKALSCETGPAQPVTQRAAGDDFKSDLLSSLMGLGAGAVGALLDNPADQNWSPADDSRQRTASQSRTVADGSVAPAHGRRSIDAGQRSQRSFPWGLVGLAGGLLLVGAMVFVYLRTTPSQGDAVAKGNPAEQTKTAGKASPDTEKELQPPKSKTSPEIGAPAKTDTPFKRPEPKPRGPAPQAKGKIPDRPRPADPDRAVAEWLAANGGSTTLRLAKDEGKPPIHVKKPGDIPGEAIWVVNFGLGGLPAETDHFADFQYLEHVQGVGANAPVDDDFLLCLPKKSPIHQLGLQNTRVTGRGLSHLAALPTLGDLFLENNDWITHEDYEQLLSLTKLGQLMVSSKTAPINDADAEVLSRHVELHTLTLDGAEITDKGIASLCKLAKLESLSLAFGSITDDGLAAFAGATKIQNISIGAMKITGTGLKHLAGLRDLTVLSLGLNPLTNDGVQNIVGLTNLEVVGLGGCEGLTDESLRHVAQLPRLKFLDLSRCTGISDKGLTFLFGVKSLQTLGLQGTKISKEGMDAFKKALPGCQIATE